MLWAPALYPKGILLHAPHGGKFLWELIHTEQLPDQHKGLAAVSVGLLADWLQEPQMSGSVTLC